MCILLKYFKILLMGLASQWHPLVRARSTALLNCCTEAHSEAFQAPKKKAKLVIDADLLHILG
jgi:hypothetical protein